MAVVAVCGWLRRPSGPPNCWRRPESSAAFGRDSLYLERYLPSPRHIEVQVLADAHGGTVCLGDRDCSVQRRHQKLVEEAPAPGLTTEVRLRMAESAARLARAIGYVGAGTVEFLVDGELFYFLEMNTRIQVEHPVTELVFGIDLVHEQLRIAGGSPLGPAIREPSPRGHAIECRITAEDPGRGFLPVPGIVSLLRVPSGPGVRFDTGYDEGDAIPRHYDSLVGKLVVWGPDRTTALSRMRDALARLRIEGVPTSVPACAAVLADPVFQQGAANTSWFESCIEPGLPDAAPHRDNECGHDARDGVVMGGRRYVIPMPPHPGARRSERRAARPIPRASHAKPGTLDGTLTSPLQGTVVAVHVTPGAQVRAGDVLVTLESMKMELPVQAPADARVEAVQVLPGDAVSPGQLLVAISPS